MSAVGSRVVIGASRWLEALIPAGPTNRRITPVIASKARVRATNVVLFLIDAPHLSGEW
jgi:hypothetical protein